LPRIETGEAGVHRISTQLEVYGRRWLLTVDGGEAYVRRQHLQSPMMVLLTGIAITASLAALLAVTQSGRRRRHDALAGQARLAAIVDSSADAIVGKDMDGRITSWNRGAERLFGHSAEQAIGRTVAELLVPPHLKHEEQAILRQLAAGDTVTDVETQRLHRDGHLIDVWVAVAPVRHPDGTVIGAAKTVRDITERKAAELRVRAANARLEDTVAQRTAQLRDTNLMLNNVLDAATGVAIIATATDGSITVFNRGAERMLGYQAEELLNRATPERFHDPEEVAARAAELSVQEGVPVSGMQSLVMLAERAGTETREWTYVRRDGSRLAVSLIVTAMVDVDGGLAGYLGVAMDITQRQELLASLQGAKEDALAASAAKSNFLANMSHEIRTPMNAVLGMLQLLQGTALSPRQRDYLAKANGAARSLLQLLNDVLDYSKIEAGKLSLDPHPFDADAMLRDLAVVLGGNQADKDVEIIFDVDPLLPPVLIGDRLRLQQILINLAGNALKFTERGHVKVQLQVVDCAEGQLRLRVSVSDTGIGISPEQRSRIFDGFTQAEASISRRYGGTGLGLVICSRLLALMKSELKLSSEIGAGSTFWFEVELCWGQLPAEKKLDISVLIAHAYTEAGAALFRCARGLGWQATLATDGTTAVTTLDKMNPQVVLMACGLPQQAILESALARPGSPPLIQLARSCAAPDTGSVLTMPTTPHTLMQAVKRALEGPAPLGINVEAPKRLQGMRILLVEDNALNQMVAGELLAGEGALVTVANNGSDCLKILTEKDPSPDVVLMDMQMPEMDGLEATRKIRASLGDKLRIIAMTANAGESDRASCLEAGMNDHIGKPIDLEQLVRCLCQSPTPSIPDAAAADVAYEPATVVLARFGGNSALYSRALDGFNQQSRELSSQALTALRSGDYGAASAALHTYKGVAATLGARGLATQISELEQAVKSIEPGDRLLALLTALESTCFEAVFHLKTRLPALDKVDSDKMVTTSLTELQDLLATGNMRALEWADTIDPNEDVLLAQIAERIYALDFSGAQVLLKASLRID
jgi:PAS domain S-box-containing protein